MKDRLHILIQSEKLSSSKFADKIGVQRSSISHILSGRNNPSMDFIQKVLKAFPYLNSDWLLIGKGDMYNTVTEPTIFEVSSKNDENKEANISSDIANNEHNKENIIKNIPLQEQNIPDTNQGRDEISSSDEEKVKTTLEDKKIDKIVIFYKDRTFVEYFPE
jgi:transcriptional regulator with XRE-family HTH domain